MQQINYCGNYLPADKAIISANSRGLKYGDGVFETIKFINGKSDLLDDHFDRLLKGIQLLQMNPSAIGSKEKLLKEIEELLHKNNIEDASVRIHVFRGDGYFSEDANTEYIISSTPLPPIHPNEGIAITIYKDAKKTTDVFSNIKHCNYLPYLMGARYAKISGFDDALILNQWGRICDSTIANIFFIRDQTIHTPPLSEGCVAGVFRKFLLEKLPRLGFQIKETEIDEAMLMLADEVFLTNSIRGIIPVTNILGQKLKTVLTEKIKSML